MRTQIDGLPTLQNLPRMSKGIVAEMKRQVEIEYWSRGDLKHLCMPNGQTWLYDKVRAQPKRFPGEAEPILALCHRRFGKSFAGVLMAVERAIRQPGAVVWFVTDTTEHAREIVDSMISSILDAMPGFFSFRTRRSTWFFKRDGWPRHLESRIILRGLNHNFGGSMRGNSADAVFIDEARDVTSLEYVVKRVIVPMFKGREDPTFVMLTTPPDSMDHDVAQIYYPRALENDSLFRLPARDNPDWTAEDEKLMLAEYGSTDNVHYRVEVQCEMIANLERMVVPEWPPVRPNCLLPAAEYVRPDRYFGWVAGDFGFVDHVGVIFCLADYYSKRVVVLDELFLNYKGTDEIAAGIHEKIRQNYPEEVRRRLHLVADANPQQLYDLRLGHNLSFRKALLHDKEASIAAIKGAIAGERVLVLDNCRELDNTLSNLIWNKNRTDFERSKKMGHGDLFSALRYLWRAVNLGANPTKPPVIAYDKKKFYNPYAKDNWMRTGVSRGTNAAFSAMLGKDDD